MDQPRQQSLDNPPTSSDPSSQDAAPREPRESREPREPPRHAKSNNWRTRVASSDGDENVKSTSNSNNGDNSRDIRTRTTNGNHHSSSAGGASWGRKQDGGNKPANSSSSSGGARWGSSRNNNNSNNDDSTSAAATPNRHRAATNGQETPSSGSNNTGRWGPRRENNNNNNNNNTTPAATPSRGSTDWRSKDPEAAPSPSKQKNNNFHKISQKPSSHGTPADASEAVADGRRIYMGNMFYHVRPEQISETLKQNGCTDVERIHISIDPVTGRNPGYCFVEFSSRETATAAIERMAGVEIMGRPLKTGSCDPKTKSLERQQQQQQQKQPSLFERWGNLNSDGKAEQQQQRGQGQGPAVAEDHLFGVVRTNMRVRVYVGGLDRMTSQYQSEQELRTIFKQFKITAIGKRITPHESVRSKPGKHHYAFVDLESEDEAKAAIEALNGSLWKGSRLKVSAVKAKTVPEEIIQRGTARYGDEQEHGDESE